MEIQSKLLSLALNNRKIAVATLAQSIIDEGSVGAANVTIFYANKSEAKHLWRIANFLGYANPLRKKKCKTHYQYGFSIKASKLNELYEQIGPLPHQVKDKVLRHLAKRHKMHVRPRYQTRERVLRALRDGPKTALQLMFETDISHSTLRKHLRKLQEQGLVIIYGRNNTIQRSRRTAYLWAIR